MTSIRLLYHNHQQTSLTTKKMVDIIKMWKRNDANQHDDITKRNNDHKHHQKKGVDDQHDQDVAEQ